MAVRTPTQWTPPNGAGYVTQSSGAFITSQSGVVLSSQSGVDLIISPEVYQPKYDTAWTKTSKNTTTWLPPSGSGYVVTIGNEQFVTNSGNSLVTNSGNNLVTTPTYDTGKNLTSWTVSGV